MEDLAEDQLQDVLFKGSSAAVSSPSSNAFRLKTPSTISFSLDDAFSESEDNDLSFEFSPQAIREEMAKSMSPGVEQWDYTRDMDGFAQRIGYSGEADASVSTFDIDAHPDDEPISPPTQQPPSPESQTPSHPSQPESLSDLQLTSEFSSISLSEHPSPSHETPEEYDYANQPDEKISPKAEGSTLTPEPGESPSHFPVVQIDAAPDLPTVQEVIVASPTPDRQHTQLDLPISPQTQYIDAPSSMPNTPMTKPATSSPYSSASHASASSVPIPSSSSYPSPASAQSASAMITRHRQTKSMGPSMLDKVVSKTRPNFLPPKDRQEDRKHLADWETMMKNSRAAEEKRRKALQERRFARERNIEASIHHWEKEILPDWRVVHKNPALRKLWWEGIPTKLRATMWQNAVGNDLALSKDAFKSYLARANRALNTNTFPTTVLGLIDDDIKTTLPTLHLFAPQVGPLYQDLKDILCAWVVSRSDEGLGYIVGVAKIAAMLLINMAPAPAFLVLRNLLERHLMRSFYGGMTSQDDVEAYYRIFDTLLADGMPKIYFNFKQHQISPSSYLPDWILPLFLDHLPFEACARLWDILLLEGDSFLFRASLAILSVLEPRLFFPDKQELLELLKGENKAAIEVAKRDGVPINGAKYDIYGVNEETLWERLERMDDWWKESTWTRLIQRELPDL